MSLNLPTLPAAVVESEIDRLENRLREGRSPSPFPDGGHHPRAVFAALGGPPVPVHRLQSLHDAVAKAGDVKARTAADRDRRFDVAVGSALAEWFDGEGRAQASRPEVWPYLTLVVLPDLAVRRFGADRQGRLPRDRFRAGRRNVFYRAYLRAWILGDMLEDRELSLYEDELVGLVDRNLSADHRLARALSRQIAQLPQNGSRRVRAREGMKRIQFELRVTDVEALDERELEELAMTAFTA